MEKLENLLAWFEDNEHLFSGMSEEYRTLMENFRLSCEHPEFHDYVNFKSDIRFYSREHQAVLRKGFFAMYGLNEQLFLLASGAVSPDMN